MPHPTTTLTATLTLALAATPALAQGAPASTPEFLPNTGSSAPFSRAVQVGDTLYLAGQLGLARSSDADQTNGIEAETRRAMERIGETLALYGLTHDALFKCTVWLADIDDFGAFNAVYAKFFQEGRYPTRSTMAVKDLAAGAQIEIECIAHSPSSPATALAMAMTRPFVATKPSDSGEVLSDFRRRIPTLGHGAYVYVQRDRGGKPYRQRVLQLINLPGGPDETRVAQIAWSLKDPERFANAPNDPSVLSGIDKNALHSTFKIGCTQEWTFSDDPEPTWTGVIDPEDCTIMSERRGEEIRIGAEAKITPDAMYEAERGFSLDGKQLWGTPEGEYALVMKVGE